MIKYKIMILETGRFAYMENPVLENVKEKRKVPIAVIAVIVALALVALVVGGYCGLCKWVQDNGRLMPGTVACDATGEVSMDLSGMLAPDAVLSMSKRMSEHLARRVVTITYGDGQSEQINGSYLSVDPKTPVDYAVAYKAQIPFLKLGLLWLGLTEDPVSLSLSAAMLTEEGEREAERIAQYIAETVYIAPVDYTCQLDEAGENVLVKQGCEGRELDADALARMLKQTLLMGNASLEAEYIPLSAKFVDAQTIYDMVYKAPVDPYLQDNGRLSLPVDGVTIDLDAAVETLAATAPGGECVIPLLRVAPDFATCQDILYQDVLAENVSRMDGVPDRSFNVKRAAELCNEVVLMPGEVFSYLGTVWNEQVRNSYMMGTGYANGKTVDMYGGGICQVSSAIYYCTVYSNLEIVKRANHAFLVTYVPKGLDATVYSPTLDFKFRNNTPYPIKIVTTSDESDWGSVTVKILGSKTDDTYVQPEIIELYSVPWETVYKPDNTIPVGTTKVDVTPYTGYAVDVYRCVYDGEGNLISRTYENFSKYAKRDKVILFNPADAERLGLNPDGTPLPKPAAAPVEPETPAVSDENTGAAVGG